MGFNDMTSRGETNVIRVNATSIDVSSSEAITFGYVNELARAGRIIAGRHRLQSPLSSSGATPRHHAGSSLWRADSLHLDCPVLVELLDPAIAEDPSLTELFESEVHAAAAVSSPCVSRVLDFGIEYATPYLVTEFGSGETLATRIASSTRPAAAEFAGIFRELARAVTAMHSVGMLHRDLRSQRVQLSAAAHPGGVATVKVSFGISKILNDTLDLVRTMARRAIAPAAAPEYASPEQILGCTPLDAQSDLWSLAVIAFEALTGQLPFAGVTLGERLVQICTGAARVPSEVAPVPRGFDAWFARGVSKAPSDRWGSAREMADALQALAARPVRAASRH